MKKKKKNRAEGLPDLIIPDSIIEDMHDWILAKIQSIPQNNITQTVSEWCEENRSLSSGLTARAGRVEYSTTPYLREIADNLSDMSPVIETYLQKATQVGGTVMLLEAEIGYCIQYGIGPVLLVAGDESMAQETMEKKIDEMIVSSNLQDKIKPNVTKARGNKGTGDTVNSKSYGGTFLKAVGPNSESKLRSFPMRILLLDEIDVYPQKITRGTDSTADPIEKAERRADSYGNLRKICGISTPKAESTSRIAEKFEDGDKRYYNIKCPGCGLQQPWLWKNLKWSKNEKGEPDIKREMFGDSEVITNDPTYFECMNDDCDYKMRHSEKKDLIQEVGYGGEAEWIPTQKSKRPFVKSYHLPAWYGFRTWIEIVQHFYRVKDDPFKFPTFVNDCMAEPWKESEDKPDEHQLFQLSQQYEKWDRGFIKKEVMLLTLGVDIQKNRIEMAVLGHARNRQMYCIDYHTFEGDPSKVEDKSWSQLSEVINKKYSREDGQELFINTVFIDRQFLSETVDAYCDIFPYSESNMQGVFPIISRDTQDKLVKQTSGSNIKTPVVSIHDQELKRGLYSILKKRPITDFNYPSHYIHFSYQYGPEFYSQLTAEEIEPVIIKNVKKGFLILNSKQRRNEVLDTVKYAIAAFQFSMDRFFKSTNEYRKSQKQKEIQEDVSLFMDYVEESLML